MLQFVSSFIKSVWRTDVPTLKCNSGLGHTRRLKLFCRKKLQFDISHSQATRLRSDLGEAMVLMSVSIDYLFSCIMVSITMFKCRSR